MRQDRSETRYLDLVEDLIELLGHEVLVQLDQQVRGLIDGEAAATAVYKLLDVLVGKVKVAAQQKLRRVADPRLQLRNLGLIDFGVEKIAVVTVGSSHQVGDAVRRRHLGHRDRHLECLGAVVNPGQRVAMDIDHL